MDGGVASVFAAFGDDLATADPAPAGATDAELDSLAAVAGPLPAAYRALAARAGGAAGPLILRGPHVTHDWSVAALTAHHRRRADRRARAERRGRARPRGAPFPPELLEIGLSQGRCEDCGPVVADRAGLALRPGERALVADDPAEDPPLFQVDDPARPATERWWIAESCAAWAFEAMFEAWRLTPAGHRETLAVAGGAPATLPRVLTAAAAACADAGLSPSPGSRFRSIAHFERTVAGWRDLVVRVGRPTGASATECVAVVAGQAPPDVGALAGRLRRALGAA